MERISRMERRRKIKKKDEPSTYDITVGLLESGLNLEAIAKKRDLARSTIEGHLAKAVEVKRISIYSFMSEEQVTAIDKAIKEMPEDFTSKDLFTYLKGEFSYSQLRAVMNRSSLILDRAIE